MRRTRTKTFLLYTVVFAVLFYLCFWYWNRQYNKSIMCLYDGMNQCYLYFVYIGRWLRECARTIFISHSLNIPMYDIGIGFGDDIFAIVNMQIADPFMWIFSIAPESHSETAYTLMIVCKLYAAGLAFLWLCARRSYNPDMSIIGAIVYVFSAHTYMLNMGTFFLNPLYIFPIVIIGVDELWNRRRSRLFILSIAWLITNNFYIAYMGIILVVLYCVVRLLEQRANFCTVRAIIGQIGKYLVHGILGAGLSMACLLPMILIMFSSNRAHADFDQPILYTLDYYLQWFSEFTGSYMMLGRDSYIGFPVIAFIGILILFGLHGKFVHLKAELVLLTIGMFIPAWGSLMNGMGYCANRWSYAYVLLVAIVTVEALQHYRDLSHRAMIMISAIMVVYLAWRCWYTGWRETIPIILVCVIILIWMSMSQKGIDLLQGRAGYVSLLALAMISAVIPAFYHFSEDYDNAIAVNAHTSYCYDTILNAGALPILRDVEQSNNTRFDSYNAGTISNETMMYGVSGMELYSSFGNNYLNEFMRETGLLTKAANTYFGLNRRTELDHLMGAERFLVTTGEESVGLPYGYSELELTEDSHGQDYSSYHTTYGTSLVHTFSNLVSASDYESLDPLDRQQVLMQAAVIDDTRANSTLDDLDLDEDAVDYSMELVNVTQEGNVYHAKQGSIVLTPADGSILSDGEVYVYLKGIDYSSGENNSYNVYVNGLLNGEDTGYTERLRGTNNKNHIYEGRHDWLICIGNIGAGGIDSVSLEFEGDGTYTIEDIGLYFRSDEELAANLDRLNVFDGEVSLDTNEISFTTNADAEQYYLISVPYSTGWKATIDGASAEIIKADTAFMLVEVPAGTHEIVLHYCTPGLVPGILCAILSLAVIMVWYLHSRRVERGSVAAAQ